MTREEAARVLREAGIPDAAGDARRLAEHFCAEDLAVAVAKRSARVPVSQIIGRRAFWKSEFRVTADVLDPRPETETLVEVALSEPFSRVLDLGTGSGCILVSLLLERPDARGVGTDTSDKAVLVAGDNAARLGVADRIVLPISDWFADIGGTYDLIVSNPPYIARDEIDGLAPEVRDHEPRQALDGGTDGLDAYRAIAAGAAGHLAANGRVIVEIGPTQAAPVKAIFQSSGFDRVTLHADLDGRDRVVQARRSFDSGQ